MKNMSLPFFPRQNKLSFSERTFLSDFNIIQKNKVANQKLEAFAIYTLLKMSIGDCSETGFYLKADEKHINLLANEVLYGIDVKFLKRVLNSCFNNGLFDKSYYDKFNILTSYDIQSEYFFCEKVKERVISNLPQLKDLIYDSIWESLKNKGKNEKNPPNSEKSPTNNGETKPDEDKTKKNTNNNTNNKTENTSMPAVLNYPFSLNDLKKQFPNKKCSIEAIPDNVDLKLLAQKISESNFLLEANNLSIDWCVNHYDDIINDYYKNYDKKKVNSNEQETLFNALKNVQNIVEVLPDE